MGTLLEDLSRPEAFAQPTGSVAVVQTHISVVFVADDFVYKVKKPVNFGFLDFTTLELRRHFCEEEVRLNRRLSPDMYLGVLPILFDGHRHRLGEGSGDTVEHCVWMRRIPQERLMRSLLAKGELERHQLAAVARVLARFATEAQTSSYIASFGELDRFRINTDENFLQTAPFIGRTIDAEQHKSILIWTDRFYAREAGLFQERVKQGRIRDCHGDLHMDHICIADKVSIFDCIEFNERFRYSDTLSDIAFLLMDLEFHGAWEHAKVLWELYAQMAGEVDVDELLVFYKVYRAFVRGKVNSFQLDDPEISDEAKAQAAQKAKRYFDLAASYIQ